MFVVLGDFIKFVEAFVNGVDALYDGAEEVVVVFLHDVGEAGHEHLKGVVIGA